MILLYVCYDRENEIPRVIFTYLPKIVVNLGFKLKLLELRNLDAEAPILWPPEAQN